MAFGSAGPSPAAAASRVVMSSQVAALSEKFNQMVQRLQQQCEGDRRRLNQVERRLEVGAEDRTRHGEQRERWAELQGKVDGLIEETQSLTRRVEGLDERLWTRTSGSEGARQRGRELEQQVQALEQQARLSAATAEESSRRQAAKLRRAEHAAEEAVARLARLEDDLHDRAALQRDGFLEARLGTLEQQQEQLDDLVRSLQAQVDEGLPGFAGLGEGDSEACGPRLSAGGRDVDEVLHAVEQSHSELERKVMKQVEDQAAFRVKVDHQLSRVSALADRLETAHEPALEALRSELASQRSQDRQLADGEAAALRRRIQESADGAEDALAEVREGLRELRALQGSPKLGPRHDEDGGALRGLLGRLADLEQRAESLEDAVSLRGRSRRSSVADRDGGIAQGVAPGQDLEGIRSRLEWLEEQTAARAAEGPDHRHAADAQDKMYRVLERLSCLEQQTSRGEVDKLHQQLQQLQDLVERRHTEGASRVRSAAEAESRVGAVSQQVALLAARLSEVEGGLEFAREAGDGSGVSEAGSARPPLPRGEAGRDRGDGASAAAAVEIQDKLVHVAEHLEAERSEISELSRRLETVERQLAKGEPEAPRRLEAGAVAKVQGELEALSKRLRGLEEGAEPKVQGELDALSKRLRGLEEGAEPNVQGELEALSKRLRGLEESAEPKVQGELEALSKRLRRLEEDTEPKVQGELEALSKRLRRLEEGTEPKVQGELETLSKRLRGLEEGAESKGEMEALSTRVCALEDSAEPKAKLEALSEQLGALKGDMAALSERQDTLEGAKPKGEMEALSERLDALEEGARPKGELEAISKRLLLLEGAEPPEDMSELRGELSQLAKQVRELQGQRSDSLATSKEPSSELQSELEELRGKLELLEEELESKVGTVRDDTSGAKAAAAELSGKVSEVEGEVKKLAGQPWKDALDGQQKTLADLQSKLDGIETNKATLDVLHESTQEHKKEIEAMRGRVEAMEKQAVGMMPQVTLSTIDELKSADEELKANVESASVEVRSELETLCKRLDDLEVATGPPKAAESAEREARERQAALEELARGSRTAVSELEAKLAARIQAVEGQLDSRPAGGTDSGGGDAKARADVQEKVSELEAKLAARIQAVEGQLDSRPAGGTDSGGGDAKAKADVQEKVSELEAKLAARIQAVEEQLDSRPAHGADSGGGDARARADVQEKVSELTAQLAKELKDLERQKEELQSAASAAIQKASADPGDETLRPQDVAAGAPRQAALDSLAKEVAESGRRATAAEDALKGLRLEVDQMRSAPPKVGIGVGGGSDDLRGRMDLLDKQIGEIRLQLKGRATPPGRAGGRSPAGEEPLDFSLTGASEQMRGTVSLGEEPLDFSLTGTSDRPANLGDSLNFSLTEAPKKDALAPEPTPGGAAAQSADSGGGARGVGLGGVAAGGARSRPSPLRLEAEERSAPLSPVQEGSASDDRRRAAGGKEDADQHQDALGALVAGQQSAASPPAAGRSPSAASPASAGAEPAAASPAKSPGSDRLATSHLAESVVSQSGNEVSAGADYSVEDSTELEKCDYFETVEPSGSREDASPSGPGDALDGILEGRPRPPELKSMGLTPVSEAPKSAASTGTVIRHSPEASGSPTGGAAAGPTAGSAGQDAGAGDYEESFDDDMSIPEESMPSGSSVEGSGSEEV